VNGQILFSSIQGGAQNIYRMNSDGTGVTQITAGGGAVQKVAPAVSPDGQRLAWAQQIAPGGQFEIYTSNIDGTNAVRLTDFAGNDVFPHWIANDALAWHRDVGVLNSDIVRADWPGGGNLLDLTPELGGAAGTIETQPGQACVPNKLKIITTRDGGLLSQAFVVDAFEATQLEDWRDAGTTITTPMTSATIRCRD
jgi:hypothetical protein